MNRLCAVGGALRFVEFDFYILYATDDRVLQFDFYRCVNIELWRMVWGARRALGLSCAEVGKGRFSGFYAGWRGFAVAVLLSRLDLFVIVLPSDRIG